MWRRHIIIFIFFVCVCGCKGESVNRKEAQRIADTFFNAVKKSSGVSVKLVYTGKGLTTDKLFSPYYVYNSAVGGFVVVAAENKAFPILAFDAMESFDPNALDMVFHTKLKQYARDIELIRYDPRVPYKAIEAWENIPDYIMGLLKDRNYSTDRYFREYATEYGNLDHQESIAHPDSTKEYVPFSFHEKFMKETRSAIESIERDIEEELHPSSPIVKSMGDGHFEIVLPEDVVMVRIYNLEGVQVETSIFRDTNIAIIKLDAHPEGFYFLLLNGKGGKSYGVKLYK